MAITCSGCGQSWERDPAIEVECPSCRAPVGVRCRRPSGHSCEIHAERDMLALRLGFLAPCPAGKGQQRPSADQQATFAFARRAA